MKMPIQFDTLGYARKLETAGIPRSQAEAHADALGEALGKAVVTPGDLTLMGNQLRSEIKELDVRVIAKIDALEIKLNNKIDALEIKLNNKIDALEIKLNDKIDALDVRLSGRMDVLAATMKALDIKFTEKFKLIYWMLSFSLMMNVTILFKLFLH